MNGIDLDLFDSCAFMLSPEGEWLGENQIFSNNNFLKNAKKKIIQHFEKIKQNITPNECLMIGSNCLKFSLLKMANKNFIVLCVVEHDASITKNSSIANLGVRILRVMTLDIRKLLQMVFLS